VHFAKVEAQVQRIVQDRERAAQEAAMETAQNRSGW
jgi:hypothetical protein